MQHGAFSSTSKKSDAPSRHKFVSKAKREPAIMPVQPLESCVDVVLFKQTDLRSVVDM